MSDWLMALGEVWVYQRAATLMMRQSDLSAATVYLRQAQKVSPNDLVTRRMLGYLAEVSGRWAEAQSMYQQAGEWASR